MTSIICRQIPHDPGAEPVPGEKKWDENVYCGMRMGSRNITFPQTRHMDQFNTLLQDCCDTGEGEALTERTQSTWHCIKKYPGAVPVAVSRFFCLWQLAAIASPEDTGEPGGVYSGEIKSASVFHCLKYLPPTELGTHQMIEKYSCRIIYLVSHMDFVEK